MNFEMNRINKMNDQNVPELFLGHEHAGPKSSAASDGALFPPIPSLKHIALTTATFAVRGTASAPMLTRGRPVHLVLGVRAAEDSGAKYNQLRAAIAASGLPFLSDDELRSEIADRKGIKPR